MFARYVVFALVALAECAALGAPRFRMVLDLEGKYRSQTQTLGSTNELGQYFGVDSVETPFPNVIDFQPFYFNGAEKIRVGLYGDSYTSSNGRNFNDLESSNQTGQATGKVNAYADGVFYGYRAWYFDGLQTQRIGLAPEEVAPQLGHYDEWPALKIGREGRIAGSTLYSNDDVQNYRSWHFDGATTREIGPLDAEHRSSLGRVNNGVWFMTSAGDVYGHAGRYNGQATEQGSTAWFYDGHTTRSIGLLGPEYKSSAEVQRSKLTNVTESGNAFGTSDRFNGEADAGNTLWYFNGATTVPIGLRDVEYTRSDGYQSSEVTHFPTHGQFAVGTSKRYLGEDRDLGNTPWLFDDLNTIPIGLTDAAHAQGDGYRNYHIAFVSNTGFVAGYADRLASDTANDPDAWLYNPKRNETISIPIPRTEGKDSRFLISALSEDGIVLGVFRDHTLDSEYKNYRPFYFSPDDGFVDLGELVSGGDILSSSIPYRLLQNDAGVIYGRREWDLYGSTPAGMGDIVLIPIPEPPTLPLVAITLALLLHRRAKPRAAKLTA